MTGEKKQNLAAACGLYCGACFIYLAGKRGDSESLAWIATGLSEQLGQAGSGMPPLKKGPEVSEDLGQILEVKDLACEGCLSSGAVFVICRVCAFRACALEKGLTHCSQCPDSPCQELVDFSNDIFPHHDEVLANIRRQRDIGIDAWIAEQEERWRCPHCGCATDWYASQCPDCGAALSGHFSLPEGLG